MTTLHLTRGCPASGKTTWAKAWVEEGVDRVRINRDDLRFALFGRYWDVSETLVSAAQHAAIEHALRSGADVVVDDTNLNHKTVKPLLRIAAQEGAEVEWHDEFLAVPLPDLLARDRAREKSVGDKVIMSFYQRYLQGGKIPVRTALDDNEIMPYHAPYDGTPGKPDAMLIDLDGTIAHNNGYRKFYDWHKVGGDAPHNDVIWLLNVLDEFVQPIFVSGREDVCYKETREWIEDNYFAGYGSMHPARQHFPLFMRKAKDQRKDSIVKLEIFDEHIRDNYNVLYCFDDRQQVVDAYRSIGLRVLQVQSGNF